jgi:toxin CptA
VRTAPAVAFDHRPSRVLASATLAISLLALWAIVISGVPEWLRLVLMLSVVLSGAASLIRLLRPRVRSLLWRSDGSVELVLRDRARDDGSPAVGMLQGARVMGPLVVLTLHWPLRGRATLWLLPDNLDPDTHRRLRMRLGSGRAGAALSGNADSG